MSVISFINNTNIFVYVADSSRLQTVQVQNEATIVHLQSELKAVKLKCKQEHGETQVNLMIFRVKHKNCHPVRQNCWPILQSLKKPTEF